jgi:hypothetical protein
LKSNRNLRLFKRWIKEQSNHANRAVEFDQDWYDDWLENRANYNIHKPILDNLPSQTINTPPLVYPDHLHRVYPKLLRLVYQKYKI